MATYADIVDYARERSGFAPKTCWIAHVKELNGLPVRRAWNRAGSLTRKRVAQGLEPRESRGGSVSRGGHLFGPCLGSLGAVHGQNTAKRVTTSPRIDNAPT